MLDSLKHWIIKDVPAATVTPAEQVLAVVEQGTEDRRRRLASEEEARQQAALAEKLEKLHHAEHDLALMGARKAELLSTIRGMLVDLLPHLTELDSIEQRAMPLSSAILGLQSEAGRVSGHGWRDAVLPGASPRIKAWLQRLEA